MPPLQEQVLTSSTVPGDVKFKAGALLGACGNMKRSRLDADATFPGRHSLHPGEERTERPRCFSKCKEVALVPRPTLLLVAKRGSTRASAERGHRAYGEGTEDLTEAPATVSRTAFPR